MGIKTNQVVLLGRIGWKNIKYHDSGAVSTTISLGVKRGQDKWNNFFIKFFNSKQKNTAEILYETAKEGDYVQITGRLQETKYIPDGWEGRQDDKGNQITKSNNEIVGYSFKKCIWNDETEEFEYLDGDNA